jgi:FkbM family methyltransferase
MPFKRERWEPDVRDFILQHAFGICADIGAATGTHAQSMSSVSRVERVHAFEPVPENIAKIRKLNDPKIEIHPFALGKENGTLQLYVNHPSPSQWPWLVGHRRDVKEPTREIITVEQKRLCDVLPSVDFLKIDTEGMEYDIFLGAKGVYDRAWLVVEYHLFGDYAPQELEDLLCTTHEPLNKVNHSFTIQHQFFRPK